MKKIYPEDMGSEQGVCKSLPIAFREGVSRFDGRRYIALSGSRDHVGLASRRPHPTQQSRHGTVL